MARTKAFFKSTKEAKRRLALANRFLRTRKDEGPYLFFCEMNACYHALSATCYLKKIAKQTVLRRSARHRKGVIRFTY